MRILKARSGDFIQGLNEEAIKQWEAGVIGRAGPFVNNILHSQCVSEIDSNWNIGVLVQKTTGLIYPFEYDKIKSINVTAVPITTTQALLRYAALKLDRGEDVHNSIDGLSVYCDKYDVYYEIKYNNESGDRFHNPGDAIYLTSRCLYDGEDVAVMQPYIESMVKNHAKIISLT